MDAKQEDASEAAQTAESESTRQEENPSSGMAASGDGASAQSDQEACNSTSKEMKVQVEVTMTQADLEELAASERGKKATKLIIDVEDWDDVNPPVIDFGAVSFPNLKLLDVSCQALKALNFQAKDYPNLRHICLHSVLGSCEYVDFDLPQLRTMQCESVEVDNPEGFGRSLSRSPRLTKFIAYKLWGLYLGGKRYHTLVLPRCEQFSLYRSDTVDRLKFWAPRLKSLDLRACYDIREVIILDTKPAEYTGKLYEFVGEPSPYNVNILNTCQPPRGNVLIHPRCVGIYGNLSSEDDDGSVWGF